jgi:hypothetical protein
VLFLVGGDADDYDDADADDDDLVTPMLPLLLLVAGASMLSECEQVRKCVAGGSKCASQVCKSAVDVYEVQ